MLPLPLRAVFALNSAQFPVSSLALLSIVNTRVAVAAEYLPAYGAVAFLPYSLRPIFAWASSRLLSRNEGGRRRHDRLLFPSFLLACFAMAGTTLVPRGGVVLCFVFGFLRGTAGAWTDFLLGMAVIEFSRATSKAQARFLNEQGAKYEEMVSVNTAQSSTAKNVGMFAASLATFLFFAQTRNISESTANALLFATAGIFLLAALTSLKYQAHVRKILANSSYGTIAVDSIVGDGIDGDGIDGNDLVSVNSEMEKTQHEVDALSSNSSSSSSYGSVDADNDDNLSEGRFAGETKRITPHEGEDDIYVERTPRVTGPPEHDSEGNETPWQQIFEVATLVSFQSLLAVAALEKPIAALFNRTIWAWLLAGTVLALVCSVCAGYHHEQTRDRHDGAGFACTPSRGGISHRRLNLYFLLRYSIPIAGFIMYSYQYTVFESEPEFLQLLSVLNAVVGAFATLCYQRFLAPRCYTGWPLLGLIAFMDVATGLVALLDVWVVRAATTREVEGKYVIDRQLRVLAAAVGLTKYFFGELDYMPALVLSTTNVRDCEDKGGRSGGDTPVAPSDDAVAGELGEAGALHARVDALEIDTREKEEQDGCRGVSNTISAEIQYASFLSCIDFGAQIGDWISVPIIAAFGISRENNWDGLDRFVVMCCFLRMARVLFLCVIRPK